MTVHLFFYLYFHDRVSLIVRSHIKTHIQYIRMARKTEADKMKVFTLNAKVTHFVLNHTSWCLQNENRLLVITTGHFINEQILRSMSKCIALTVQNWLWKGIFAQTKTELYIFTRYQRIKIEIILRRNLNLVRVLLSMPMQTLSVKLLSYKSLK